MILTEFKVKEDLLNVKDDGTLMTRITLILTDYKAKSYFIFENSFFSGI